MPPYNVNWDRWVMASVRVYFTARKQSLTLFMAPGGKRDGLSTYGELRIDGPFTQKLPTEWRLSFIINVLVAADLNNKDGDLIYKSCGIVQSIFTDEIPVFKYGNGQDDDQSFLGCLVIQGESRQSTLRTSNFGQFDKNAPLTQSSVEGTYLLCIGDR